MQESEKKGAKEKKSRGKQKHAEPKSFIPLFREPSSIEKILGEADELKLLSPRFTLPVEAVSPRVSSYRFTTPSATSPPRVASPKASSRRITSPRPISPKAHPPKISRNRKEISYAYRPEPTLRNHNLSATKIQAAYRGYMVSFKIISPCKYSSQLFFCPSIFCFHRQGGVSGL